MYHENHQVFREKSKTPGSGGEHTISSTIVLLIFLAHSFLVAKQNYWYKWIRHGENNLVVSKKSTELYIHVLMFFFTKNLVIPTYYF